MSATSVQDSSSPYASVPEVEPDAEVDPHWLTLRGGSLLPSVYMPPPMAGEHGSLMRAVALILIGVFVAATVAGICLTYGPPAHLLF